MKIQIMIVEDDGALAGEIRDFLERWGYHVHIARDFENIAEECRERNPRLVLMDINLPFYDGFYWCRKIREFSEVPILYISSRGEDADKLQGYAQGGDDYVEKPFRLEILQAKIEAVLRRAYPGGARSRVSLGGDLAYEWGRGELFWGDAPVELTKSERRILSKLMEHRGQTVTRDELMMTLWNTDEFVSDGTLTVLVSRLRDRLKRNCGQELIKTRKGQGYYIP